MRTSSAATRLSRRATPASAGAGFHTDHLGSISVITDENAVVLERLSYDAWGRRRHADGAPDSVGLVHMNGRVYDPLLARFGTPDPMTENPFSTQGWNRYSYVGNSPVNFTDPSGYCFLGCFWKPIFKAIGKFFSQNWRAILQIAVTAACQAVTGGGPLCAGLGSFVSGITSGDLGLALRSALISMVTAGAMSFVGGIAPSGSLLNIAGHAAVGCLSAVAARGRCGAGALAAGLGAVGAPFIDRTFGSDLFAGTVASAVLGGLGSVAGGGKFANGAVTAAFGYLFNPTGLERSGELRDTNYAVTYIDFWGNVRTDYLPAYKYLDPISQEAVRIHEGVHVEQLKAVTWEGWPFWGGFGNHRATWNGTPALEAPAFRVELDFLNRTLDAVPRSDWTVDHKSADLFRQQVQSNLWRAEQYLREGRKF